MMEAPLITKPIMAAPICSNGPVASRSLPNRREEAVAEIDMKLPPYSMLENTVK
jgi:hypothetical protein